MEYGWEAEFAWTAFLTLLALTVSNALVTWARDFTLLILNRISLIEGILF